MSRSPLPLVIADLSAFATHLRAHWPGPKQTQTATLALIAQAAGYRNHQHLLASQPKTEALDPAAVKRVKAAESVFDDRGIMFRWPKKTSVQRLCLTWCWSRLPDRQDLTEGQVNDVLQSLSSFGDHVLLRRSLIDHGYASRTRDGSTYRRIGRIPDAEERAFLRHMSERVVASVA